jgi:hypothetical protein
VIAIFEPTLSKVIINLLKTSRCRRTYADSTGVDRARSVHAREHHPAATGTTTAVPIEGRLFGKRRTHRQRGYRGSAINLFTQGIDPQIDFLRDLDEVEAAP